MGDGGLCTPMCDYIINYTQGTGTGGMLGGPMDTATMPAAADTQSSLLRVMDRPGGTASGSAAIGTGNRTRQIVGMLRRPGGGHADDPGTAVRWRSSYLRAGLAVAACALL